VIEHPDRKPGPGMLQRASRELQLDLARSWMIGDALSDVLAGRNAGCRGSILVRTGYGRRAEAGLQAADCVVDDLAAAVQYIVRVDART
jgi:D-glycero-D-manno-heptose 1,7-bisphosphate phosphatase